MYLYQKKLVIIKKLKQIIIENRTKLEGNSLVHLNKT